MIKLNELVSDSIDLVPEFSIHKKFEMDDCHVWYVLGNAVEPRKSYKDTLICKETESEQEGFHDYLNRTKDSDKLVKIAGNIFNELEWGKLDDNDTISVNFPYNHLFRLSFGNIHGFIDDETRSYGQEESQNFRIYMAPNENYFKDIDKNLKEPAKNSYTFFLEDLFKYGIKKDEIPNVFHSQTVELMFRRAWFTSPYFNNKAKKQHHGYDGDIEATMSK